MLYDYWRASAAYRVRIALGLLDLPYTAIPVNLLDGSHRAAEYLLLNPLGLVPTLEIDDQTLSPFIAILEYLDETRAAGFLSMQPAPECAPLAMPLPWKSSRFATFSCAIMLLQLPLAQHLPMPGKATSWRSVWRRLNVRWIILPLAFVAMASATATATATATQISVSCHKVTMPTAPKSTLPHYQISTASWRIWTVFQPSRSHNPITIIPPLRHRILRRNRHGIFENSVSNAPARPLAQTDRPHLSRIASQTPVPAASA